ncbi:MAG: cytochrome C oxidase subunit IV family protein [Candidatus Binatia bacterium]|nr:cytochrome C oxidase subunit IV family protein [Candidatus Binatia bacterium]
MGAQAREYGSHPDYVKVYIALLVLFAISVVGPLLGHPWLTILTAFGVAAVKATMVAAYFMHLNIERRYIWYLLLTMLAFMGLLFAGVAPDVLASGGQNWQHVRQAQTPPAAHH